MYTLLIYLDQRVSFFFSFKVWKQKKYNNVDCNIFFLQVLIGNIAHGFLIDEILYLDLTAAKDFVQCLYYKCVLYTRNHYNIDVH